MLDLYYKELDKNKISVRSYKTLQVLLSENPYLKRLAGGLATFENLLEQITHDKNCETCKSEGQKKQQNTLQ